MSRPPIPQPDPERHRAGPSSLARSSTSAVVVAAEDGERAGARADDARRRFKVGDGGGTKESKLGFLVSGGVVRSSSEVFGYSMTSHH
jgi:hypothetical protein